MTKNVLHSLMRGQLSFFFLFIRTSLDYYLHRLGIFFFFAPRKAKKSLQENFFLCKDKNNG